MIRSRSSAENSLTTIKVSGFYYAITENCIEKETALRNLRKKSGVAEEEQRLLRDVIGKLETNCAHVKEQLNEEERATVDWQKLVERWTRVASEALAKAKLPHGMSFIVGLCMF